jgi:DNA-binding NarL/FixJ family response regulator
MAAIQPGEATTMSEKRRILIVDDHTLLRAGLSALLLQDPDIEIVGELADGRGAVNSVATLSPHLVLMDLTLPGCDGFEAMVEIKRRFPNVKILVLTLHRSDECIHESLRSGADGYLLKDATHDELRVAIRSVLNGKTYLSPDISAKVITGYLGAGKGNLTSRWDTVTRRERQVMKLVAEGHSNKHIAQCLCLSVKTVEKHRSNLMKKLDLHNASALTAFAIAKGLRATEVELPLEFLAPSVDSPRIL